MEEDPTKPYHHGDLRRTLIETASEMLRVEQTSLFTLREVARRAGVSHAAPYKHFADKQALLDELALHGFEQLGECLRKALGARQRTVKAQFLSASRAYVDFAAENPALYRLMFAGVGVTTHALHLNDRAMATLQVLFDLLQRGQESGVFKSRSVQQLAVACWAQVHGLAMLSMDGMLMPEKVGNDPIPGALSTLLEGIMA